MFKNRFTHEHTTPDRPARNGSVENPETVAHGDLLALRAIRAVAGENCNDLCWDLRHGHLTMLVNCSDVFFWGSADFESITEENIALLESTFEECQRTLGSTDYAADLFCARLRGERPQGAYYKHLPSAWADLFDLTGPEREVGFGNPMTPLQARAQVAQERAARQGDTHAASHTSAPHTSAPHTSAPRTFDAVDAPDVAPAAGTVSS